MPVTPANVDAAVPVAGTPDRTLTNGVLKGLITDIADVGVGVGIGTVATFADLPAPATVSGQRWWVLTSTGVWLVNRKTKGAYYSDGAAWSYLGDFPVTAVEVGFTPAAGIAANNIQAAIEEVVADTTTLINPLTLTNVPVSAPAAGALSVGEVTHAGLEMLSVTSGGGWTQENQSLLARNRTIGYLGVSGSTVLTLLPGAPALPTVLGTGTARSWVGTSRYSRMPKIGYVSAAAAGSLAGAYHANSAAKICGMGGGGIGGFLYMARFATGDAATVAGARMFVGLATATAAPTNVEPSTELNQIGVGQLSTSNNLHIIFGGSTAQTPIDLGTDFPANTLGTDFYEVLFFSSRNDNTKVTYRVSRLGTAFVASGTLTNTTPGTTLPAVTTGLGFRNWRCNNATALAVELAVASLFVHLDLTEG